MGIAGWNNVTFGMANNCSNKTLKTDRVFKTGCLAIGANGKILADADYFDNKNCLNKALRVREAPWFEETMYNDELICKANLKKCEEAGVKSLYFYVYVEDVDKKLPQLLELIDKSHYHIFDKNIGVNFHRVSSVGKLHQGLTTYAPEVKEATEDEPVIQENNLFMGCYLVHYKEGQSWTIESLKAYTILRETKESFVTRIAKKANSYSFNGDHQACIDAWVQMIVDSKKVDSDIKEKDEDDDESEEEEKVDVKKKDQKGKDQKGKDADKKEEEDATPIPPKGHLNR